jgi:predicted DNA repair protein MutK
MATIRSYRLFSLALLIAGVLALFLGFFFVWVIAPVVGICAFYLAFVAVEERRARKNGAATRRGQRREMLDHESEARDRDLDRGAVS